MLRLRQTESKVSFLNWEREKRGVKIRSPKIKKEFQDVIDPKTQIHYQRCYVCWVFQKLNLRVVLVAVRTALRVDYPSNQKEQDANAQQDGGLLVDVW